MPGGRLLIRVRRMYGRGFCKNRRSIRRIRHGPEIAQHRRFNGAFSLMLGSGLVIVGETRRAFWMKQPENKSVKPWGTSSVRTIFYARKMNVSARLPNWG